MAIPKVLRAADVAQMLSCSLHTVYRMIRCGVLRASRRVGGRGWLIEEADARACIEEFVPDVGRTPTQGTRAHQKAARQLKEAGIG